MKKYVITVITVLLCPASTLRAQGVPVAGLSADRREELTLSRTDVPRKNCALIAKRDLKPFASYIHQQKMTALLAMASTPPAIGKYALYSIKIDSGVTVSTRLVEATLPQEVTDRISASLADAIVTGGDTTTLSFRLRLDPGSATEPVRVGPSVHCPPRMLNVSQMQRALGKTSRPNEWALSTERHMTQVWVWLGADGSISKGRVGESSGDAAVDEAILAAFLKTAKWEPALRDGAGEGAWLTMKLGRVQ